MDNNTINKTQRVRGSARIQPDGTFDFKPDGQGVKKIEEVRQARKSRCYRTAGEKRRTVAAPVIQSGYAEECHAVQNDTVLISIFFENSSLDFQRYGENFVPLYRKKRTIKP